MTPCPADDQLRLLLDEQLPSDTAGQLVRHTDQCAACQQRLEHLLADSLASSLQQVLSPTIPAAGHPPALPSPDPQPTTTYTPAAVPGAPLEENFLQRLKIAPPPGARPALPAALALPGYEVLDTLGRGGMAVVYKARQASLNRLVALKMILTGAHASPAELARFHSEAEAVASLQHPNIVQIYEVGEHDGCPFFSLEFMDGGSLDQRLAGTPQPPSAAARLVDTLAQAMHYAHQHGVVHRDLKPANILLTADGTPKISDFGLAKRQATHATERTQTGIILGTPSYMAPEQAGGESNSVGPRADVYALGAVLYELLTGRPPFRGTSPLETMRQVRFDEPVPLTRLQPAVPRDLEIICLKCLRKEPDRRYPTALALADDLRRFLGNEPILARPTGFWERGVKWARRRPTAAALVLVSTFAAVLLIAGLFWHLTRLRWERDHAERNFRKARQAVDEMLTEVAQEHLASEPHMEGKRRVLLEKALKFYQEFLEAKGDDPTIQKETALAAQRVGDILRLLGRYDQAKNAYLQAIDLLTPLSKAYPSEPLYTQARANCHNFLGEVFRQTSRHAEAAESYHEALRLLDALVVRVADEPDYRMDRARTCYNLGILAKDTNQLAEAERYLGQAITDLEDLVARHDGVARYRQHLARSYLNLGPVLRQTGRPEVARERYQQAIALLKRLAEHDSENRDYRHELGVARNNLGNLLAETDLNQAEVEHATAVQLFTALTGESPLVPVYRQELANCSNSLGNVIAQQHLLPLPALGAALPGCAAAQGAACFRVAATCLAGTSRKLTEAQRAYERAESILVRLVKEHPKVPEYHGDLGMTRGNLGWVLTEQQKWHEGRDHLEQAVTSLREAVKPDPPNPVYQTALRNQYQALAETALHKGDHAAAAAAATALPQVFGDRGLDYYYAACFMARCVPMTSEPARQQAYARKAVGLLRTAVAKGVPRGQRLPSLERAKIRPLGPEAVAALADLDARTGPP
jgi:serine/threonine protein kinase